MNRLREHSPARGGITQPMTLLRLLAFLLRVLQVNKSLVTEASAVTTRDIFRRPQPSTGPQIRLVLPPVPLKTVLVLDVSQVSKNKLLSAQCYFLM